MSNQSNNDIIVRIKNLFENNKSLLQKDLSACLKKSPSTVSQWLKQNREIPADCIIPICEFFDCSISWLLTGIDDNPIFANKNLSIRTLLNNSNEHEFVTILRQLSKNDQEEILEIMLVKLKRSQKSHEKNTG